ncbi:hypothetical protein Trydic_g14307 [Trypoxylus dichotomus]
MLQHSEIEVFNPSIFAIQNSRRLYLSRENPLPNSNKVRLKPYQAKNVPLYRRLINTSIFQRTSPLKPTVGDAPLDAKDTEFSR